MSNYQEKDLENFIESYLLENHPISKEQMKITIKIYV